MNLTGKAALVTDSANGIGLGIAQVLMQAGATLILSGFDDMDAARDTIAQYGKTPDYHDVDLNDEAQTADMMRYTESEFGGVNILVSNAGIQHTSPVEIFPVDRRSATIVINLFSVFHTMRLALPGIRTRNWGRTIDIVSVHDLMTSREKSAYITAGHGVVGFTKTTALETAQTGVTCNALCPGWVPTPLAQQQTDKCIAEGAEPETARGALLSKKQPSRKFVAPEQLGRLTLFLYPDGAV